MNHEKWKRLTAAEQCAFVHRLLHPGSKSTAESFQKAWDMGLTTIAPQYVYDLNAMHEAEKICTGVIGGWCAYFDNLCLVLKDAPDDFSWAIRATAEQRAEAFVLTMEPEKETET